MLGEAAVRIQDEMDAEPPPEPVRRPARVAVMLALAHKIQDAIDRGVVRDPPRWRGGSG